MVFKCVVAMTLHLVNESSASRTYSDIISFYMAFTFMAAAARHKEDADSYRAPGITLRL